MAIESKSFFSAKNTSALVLVVILVGIGAAIQTVAYPRYIDARDSPDWPTVSGTVIRSEVVLSTNDDGDTMYEAEIEYEYTVDGKDYTCDNVKVHDIGGSSNIRKGADETVEEYSLHSTVTVYYDADDPSNAALEPGATFQHKFLLYVGQAVVVLAVFILTGLVYRHVTRDDRAPEFSWNAET